MPDPAEYKSNPDLKINNTVPPMATHPKILGLTLDQKLSYNTHIHNILVTTHNPLQIINALSTRWGKQKETLIATYKAVMRLVWSMPLPYGRLMHTRPALTNCNSCRMQL